MNINRLTVTLNTELMAQIKALAEEENRSKSNIVQVLLKEALDTRRGREKHP